ncbi:MAG TPA: SRPBCC family protein [Polyangiales bacterium]|nr:SRPBCC family protein [Polyangiales bacterium]
MASLYKEIRIQASAAAIWDAARDIGALHTRLVPGFVVDTQLDAGGRVVTFGNGMKLREPIITVDDARRRMVWSAEGGATTHYNAVLQIHEDGAGARVQWTTDFLPDSVSDAISGMQDQGLAAMKRAFENR